MDNFEIPVENLLLVIDKIKEECLKKACCDDCGEIIEALLRKDNALANFRFMDGSYVLHYACLAGSVSVIRALLYYGAVIDYEDSKGQNILYYAARNPSNEVWNYLANNPRFSRLTIKKSASGQFSIGWWTKFKQIGGCRTV